VPVDFSVPDDQSLVTHTVNRGVPLTLSHRRSAIARAVRRIAKRMSEEYPRAEEKRPDRRTETRAVGRLRAASS